MSMRDAFLQAICDAPEDDVPRLIFADWLDDHGEPERGEFIRLQCEFARMRPGDDRWQPSLDRIDDLLAEHEADWLDPNALHSWEWRRGFVEEVGVNSTSSLESARPQFEHHPVRAAGYSTHSGDLPKMAESPFLERLARMQFGIAGRPAHPALLDLLASPRLTRLAELDLGFSYTDQVLVELTRQPALPALQSIRLGNMTDEDVAAFLSCPALVGVTAFGGHNGPRRNGLAELLTTPDRWLALWLGTAELAPSDLTGLATCGRLRELSLSWPERAILTLPATLERLTCVGILDEGPPPGVVARSLGAARLTHLEYGWDPPGGTAAPGDWAGLGELLAALPGPVLDLSLTGWDTDPLPYLTRLPGLGNLRSLALSCELTSAGLDALASCESLTGLRRLEVEKWRPEFFPRLAQAPLLEGLRELEVSGSSVEDTPTNGSNASAVRRVLNPQPSPEMVARGDAAAVAFLQSPRLKRLQRLEMNRCNVGPGAIEFLETWPGLRRLRHLALYFNGLAHPFMQRLRPQFDIRLAY